MEVDVGTILKIILSVLNILGGFMTPEEKARRRKQSLLRKMDTLEQAYGRARGGRSATSTSHRRRI